MPAWACPCPAKPQASWCAVAPALTRLSGVAPDWLGLVAPRDRADADELVAYAGAFGLCVEARGTDRPPTVQHDRAPGVLGLDLETDDIATPAFLTNGRDHRLGVERRRRAPQPHPPACLNAASTPAGPSNAFHTRAASRRRGGRSRSPRHGQEPAAHISGGNRRVPLKTPSARAFGLIARADGRHYAVLGMLL